MNKWLIISACIAGLVAGVWYQSRDHRDYDRLASYDLLVESFRRVVFEGDSGPPGKLWPLNKWEDPIRARLFGEYTDGHKDFLTRKFQLYARLTGIAFSFEETKTNMDILFSDDDKAITAWARARNISDKGIAVMLKAACSVRNFGYPDGPLTDAFISIRLYPKKNWSGHCLIEETVQALGLPADKAAYRPTIFGRDDKPKKLSINDKLLIRALYDVRLKPRMTHDEAMPIARKIIRELYEAVQERGEKALYQR